MNLTSATKKDIFVSVVLSCKDQAEDLKNKIRPINDLLSKNYVDFEIVIIDNHSFDDSETYITSLLTELESIRYIRLSSEVSADVSLSAGLENAIAGKIHEHARIYRLRSVAGSQILNFMS
ncbi:glycosyltransferase, partial [Citrobacter youngae]|uniref:glycosyltransferase n=1 Tax=Citrobacter youngae TaxID=133448 RepID=UPI0013FD36E0|nr:glycosyltransferase [Citrobacter youngae]